MVDVDGEEEVVLPRLYEIFIADFKIGRPRLYDLQVHWDIRPSIGRPYEEGFIHIITETGPPHMRRAFDPPRAARIRWCAAMIMNCSCPTVAAWNYQEASGRVRTYLWRKDVQYVVILERKERKRCVYFLVTAFNTDGTSTQRGLDKKYQNRQG